MGGKSELLMSRSGGPSADILVKLLFPRPFDNHARYFDDKHFDVERNVDRDAERAAKLS